MIVPLHLLFISLAGVAVALTLPGFSDFLLLAGPCALASLFLLLRAWRNRAALIRKPPPRWIVVDGSNVMYWKDNAPQIGTVREVVQHLYALGFAPGVIFDANAGYLIQGRYLRDGNLGDLLGLPDDQVMVVGKGVPADPTILAAARDLGARIVTNDRYRDWAESHPEVRDPGHLIRGGFRAGNLWLDLDMGATESATKAGPTGEKPAPPPV